MYKTFGIFAHVDTGKTTFSEQILYYGNAIKQRGRVDHQDAYLDHDAIERQRGITIYAEQATFTFNDNSYTIIDTPGHVDFSPEMERSIQALDYAVLLVDAVDGVEGHTETVWHLLKERNVPTFIFINKMDREGADLERACQSIEEALHTQTVVLTNELDGTRMSERLIEQVANEDDALMTYYFEEGYDEERWFQALMTMIEERTITPVHFGSALQDEGVASFLHDFDRLTRTQYKRDDDFAATIYKIRHNDQGQRIAFLKIHSGVLKARTAFVLDGMEMKVGQLFIQDGGKLQQMTEAYAGQCVAVLGLKNATVGIRLGEEAEESASTLVPALQSKVLFTDGVVVKEQVPIFRMLEAEDPSLQVIWNEALQEIHLHIMGTIQLEVLQVVLKERFNRNVQFEQPTIIYKESIQTSGKGYGHFEPLKHYAEVHLRLDPLPRNSGIQFRNECHANDLTTGQQHIIEKQLLEQPIHGVLTGSDVTDVRYTLVTGKNHVKHTEGGDFQQATKRAVRQALEQLDVILLEPVYKFEMTSTLADLGKMMTDLQLAHATVSPPQIEGDFVTLVGKVPVATFMTYPTQFAAYTSGKGRLSMTLAGYEQCHNTEQVIEMIQYDRNADAAFTSNSIFCSHGKGYVVRWEDAKDAMHANVEL